MSQKRTPTPEQQVVIQAPLAPMLVIAGAGSGKTTTMADRVVHLVASGQVAPHEVLGVTFTRKAASELAARVRRELSEWAAEQPREKGQAVLLDTEPVISTYHSYAKSLVADYGLRLGVERDATVLTPTQSTQLAARIVDGYQGDIAHLSPSRGTLITGVLQLAGDCAEHLIAPEDVREWLAERNESYRSLPANEQKPQAAETKTMLGLAADLELKEHLAVMVTQFQQAKFAANSLDFGDMISLAATLARDETAVGEGERSKYKVVLLDEFQDTSHAQTVLFHSLFGNGHPVTAVGDPHQSIYGFRGASAGQLLRFPSTFRNADGTESTIATLSTAWRNSLSILEAANLMAAELNSIAEQEAHIPGMGANGKGAAADHLTLLKPRPGAESGQSELHSFLSDAEEARAIAERILQRRARGSAVESMAVLCRKRSRFTVFKDVFDELGIPYEILGLGGLVQTPEVIELVSMLKAVVDPTASAALLRVMAGARWRIGSRDLLALADYSRTLSRARRVKPVQTGGEDDAAAPAPLPHELDGTTLIDALDALTDKAVRVAGTQTSDAPVEAGEGMIPPREFSAEGLKRLLALRDELRLLRRSNGDDLLSLLGQIERQILLDVELAAKPATDYSQSRRHVDAFLDEVSGFVSSSQQVDAAAFLTWLDVAAQQEDGLSQVQPEPEPGTVQLLTVHAAKGLEWDCVFVPAMSQGQFVSSKTDNWMGKNGKLPWNLRGDAADRPQWRMDGADKRSWLAAFAEFKAELKEFDLIESRRLAYVAYTRAKDLLWVSSAQYYEAGVTVSGPEIFLAELLDAAAAATSLLSVGHRLSEEDSHAANPNAAVVRSAPWPYDPLAGPTVTISGHVKSPTASRRPALEAIAHQVHEVLQADSEPELVAVSRRWGQEAEVLLRRREQQTHSRQVQLPAHLSASTFLELGHDPQRVIANIRRPIPRQPSVAARMGTVFHAWVEDYFGSPSQMDIELDDAADEYLDESGDMEKFRQTFLDSEWAQKQAAGIEVPIETAVGDAVIRGRIDAVFHNTDGTWDLVDWKTGKVPSEAELPVKSVQLALYRLAWSRLHEVPLTQVNAAFYYVAQNRTVRPPVLAQEAELEAMLQRAYQS